MEAAIAVKTDERFAAGKVIYETGGNSKVSATMTLTDPLISSGILSGTILSGAGTNGLTVSGSASGNKGDTFLSVKYAGDTCQMSNADKSKCEYMKLI